MKYSTIFFDLDDTLYDSRTGLWDAIRKRMSLYMREILGLPWEEIEKLRQDYYQAYGTTLRGLQIHHQVNADDFLAYVHHLPLEKYLEPNPAVRKLLLGLPQKKWIFTNADADHAMRVLARLEVADCFDGIIDLRAIQFACKPEKIAYERALALAGNPDPEECVMLDDAQANLQAANQFGITTILVSQNGTYNPTAHYSVASILQLPEIMPVLWQSKG